MRVYCVCSFYRFFFFFETTKLKILSTNKIGPFICVFLSLPSSSSRGCWWFLALIYYLLLCVE
jgi:hypothetical protein